MFKKIRSEIARRLDAAAAEERRSNDLLAEIQRDRQRADALRQQALTKSLQEQDVRAWIETACVTLALAYLCALLWRLYLKAYGR